MNAALTLLVSLLSLMLGFLRGPGPLSEPGVSDCEDCVPQVLITAGNPCAVTVVGIAAQDCNCLYSPADFTCLPTDQPCYGKVEVTFNTGAGRSVRLASGACHDAVGGQVTIPIETNPGGPPSQGTGCNTSSPNETFTVCTNPCGNPCGVVGCDTVIKIACSDCYGSVDPI